MSSVKVSLTATQVPLPAGITFASVKLVLTDAAGVAQTANIDGTAVTSTVFANVGDGVGSVEATAIDTLGNVIGTPFSASFTAPIVPLPAAYPQVTALTFEAA